MMFLLLFLNQGHQQGEDKRFFTPKIVEFIKGKMESASFLRQGLVLLMLTNL